MFPHLYKCPIVVFLVMQALHKEDISVFRFSHQKCLPIRLIRWVGWYLYHVSPIHVYSGWVLVETLFDLQIKFFLLPFFIDFSHKQFTLPLEKLSLKITCSLQINIVLFNLADYFSALLSFSHFLFNPEDPAVLGRLNECLETILNKAQVWKAILSKIHSWFLTFTTTLQQTKEQMKSKLCLTLVGTTKVQESSAFKCQKCSAFWGHKLDHSHG